MPKLLLLLFCLLHCWQSFSQNINHPPTEALSCGTTLADSSFLIYRNQILAGMYARAKSGARTENTKYKIPVVVHVVEPEKTKSLISDTDIIQGIKNLNNVYKAAGDFTSSIDIGIEFELARFDPSCNPTTGITRYDASKIDWYVKSGLPYLSFKYVQEWDNWDQNYYLNIWLVSTFDKVAGVASADLGAVVLASYFVYGGVVAHEVGHYLGLAHPFPTQNGSCGCGDGDGLADTPDLMSYGIESTCTFQAGCGIAELEKINTCTGKPFGDIQRNFMNYSCQEKFTSDQRSLMREVLETYHASLLSSPALSQIQPAPIASITGPSLFQTVKNTFGVEGLRAICSCNAKPETLTINEKPAEMRELNMVPFLQFGGSVLRTFELKCSNGLTASKTVRFQRIGVTNIVRSCNQDTYSVTFDNPDHFKISASAGNVSGNSILNIPKGSDVILRAESQNGLKDSIILEPPCCTSSLISSAKCIPASTHTLDDNYGIETFKFGSSIHKTTSTAAQDAAYYADYVCSEQATVNAGESYRISVKGNANFKHYVKVYIDFDGNGDFNGANEMVLTGATSADAANEISGAVNIPKNAVTAKKLRVRVLADASAASDACTIRGASDGQGSSAGQIEDYSIYINPHIDLQHSIPEIANIVQIKTNRPPDWAANLKPFVLPNPAEGSQFDLILPDIGSYQIKLLTRDGSSIPISIRQNETSNQLRISGKSKFSPGLYILKIRRVESGTEQEVKVVVQ